VGYGMTPRLHYFERVSSTMDVLHELAATGAEAGTAVLAAEQLAGRGARGRTWHSPLGGLWLSVLFRPSAADGLDVISLRAGLSAAEALQTLLPMLIQVKWPNDLILDNQKLGGVLCEARWQGDVLGWVTIGVGINVHNDVPDDQHSHAIALGALVPAITIDEVTDLLLPALRTLDLHAGRLSADELSRFARRDWLRGREIREPVAGMVRGIGEDGALLVHQGTGSSISVRSGSVELAESLPAGNFDHATRARHREH
jgi:BirA family transcriptional regulator, biotin operon repressor / biotin---[acetyl-CoA-carboxylase] ligase